MLPQSTENLLSDLANLSCDIDKLLLLADRAGGDSELQTDLSEMVLSVTSQLKTLSVLHTDVVSETARNYEALVAIA